MEKICPARSSALRNISRTSRYFRNHRKTAEEASQRVRYTYCDDILIRISFPLPRIKHINRFHGKETFQSSHKRNHNDELDENPGLRIAFSARINTNLIDDLPHFYQRVIRSFGAQIHHQTCRNRKN